MGPGGVRTATSPRFWRLMSTQVEPALDDDNDEIAIEAPIDERADRARRRWLIAALVVIAGGVWLRLWMVYGNQTSIDSDEALAGLMAVRLLKHGDIHTFWWGQNYGGSLQSFLVAPFIA